MAMVTEAKAVQILQARLEAEGGSASITSLSVKVKWGQHDLQGFGHIRKFLSKHHEVFSLEGSSVALASLVKSVADPAREEAPKTTSKSAPQTAPVGLAPSVAPSLAPSPKEAPKRSAETESSALGEAPSKIQRGQRLNEGEGLSQSHGNLNGTANAKASTAKTAVRASAKVTAKAPLIAPTPKGSAKVKDPLGSREKDENIENSDLAKEPPPWHTQRALTRAVATPRQDLSDLSQRLG